MFESLRSPKVIFLGLIGLIVLSQASASFPYYGTKIGALKRLHHGVSGDVYAVDSRTLFIKNFNYDGEAPAAYFYVGNTNKPSNEGGHRLRDERGGTASLTRRYRNKDITLSLPEGKTLRDIKWFSVWCDEFAVNFGDVTIPNNLDFPRPQKISALKGVHAITSDNIVIVDAQTLLVPNLSYDGIAPDAKFWVGRGQHPTPQGLRIPDENGKEDPLRRYDRKTIVLTLPGDLTIFDIGHFGIWCEAFTVDFGHVQIPEGLNVPPSLKMLGISPQSKLNCEVLYDDLAFEVRWAVAGESIVIQLVAKLGEAEYMSFGISPSKDESKMIGSDVVVAWVDKATGNGFAQDYHLSDKAQCSGGRGSCPDVNIEKNTNSIRLLNAAMVNGYSIVTYQRSLKATDHLDLPITINGSEAIVWAIGPLNERKETSFHTYYTKKTHRIDFGRQPTWNCPMPEGSKTTQTTDTDDDDTDDEKTNGPIERKNNDNRAMLQEGYPPARTTSEPEEEFYDNRAQALQRPNRRQTNARPVPTPKPTNSDGAWDIPAIQCYEPEDGIFYAQIGPTGGKHGYSAITGHVGWGISWYINGLLIPEIHVVRGKTYTFVTEGGNNPDVAAIYHPFYITDDPVGGYEHKREEEKQAVRIFAGVHRSRSGKITPTGVGRLCNWEPDIDGPLADDYQSFGAYQRTLTLKCESGEPGFIEWKPDENTPDTVYYQCFTHRYLGWKIHVHDSCDDARYAASEKHEVRVPANIEQEDFDAQSSIRQETKVSPNDNFLLKHQTDLIKNHNMNGTPPKLSFEITKSSEITKLISDGIRAAEALEESILRNGNEKTQGQTATFDTTSTSTSTNSNNNNNRQQTTLGHTKSNGGAIVGTGAAFLLHQQQSLNSAETQLTNKPIISNSIRHHYNSPIQTPQAPNSQIHAKIYHSQQHSNNLKNAPHNHYHYQYHNQIQHKINNLTNLPENLQKPIGLSEYLRPPQNSPFLHVVKLPGRRPFPEPIKKNSHIKSVLPQQLPRRKPITSASQKHQVIAAPIISQPPVFVNHYRKPMPGLLPFLKEKPFPIESLAASVLLLGQPSDVGGQKRIHEPVLQGHKPKPVPVPYSDLVPQDSLQKHVVTISKPEKKKPIFPPKVPGKGKPISPIAVPPPPTFKKPFDIHEAKEEPLPSDIATMKPAINKGFQPDTVVVESGFRPIIRHDSIQPEIIEQAANRREDPGSEIDEAMETDTLFLTAQTNTQTQNFEPMFIPSPPDTNQTVIIRRIVIPIARKPTNKISSNLPEAAELRNATLDELFEGSKSDIEEEIKIENGTTTKIPENLQTEKEIEIKTQNETENVTETETDDTNTILTKRMDEQQAEYEIEKILADKDFEFDEGDYDEMPADETEYDDREAQAAERVDTYYLPPDNRKIPHAQIPSGAVVTYDGKSVIDSTLVLPPKLDAPEVASARKHSFNGGGSKLEELIRNTPQFVPFRGEVPPSIPEFLSTEKSLQLKQQVSLTPSALSPPISQTSSSSSSSSSLLTSSTSSSLRPISTKLQILKSPA